MMIRAALAFLVLVVAQMAPAVVFTNPGAFNTAISGLPGATSTLDFEAQTSGDLIPSGNSIGDITFTYTFTFDTLQVTDESTAFQDTTSPSNFLGTDFAGNFNLIEDAEGIDLTFANPLIALGLFFVSLDTQGVSIFDGDFHLITSEGTATSVNADATLLPDGVTFAYFLGVVGTNPFSSAQLRTCGSPTGCGGGAGGGGFFFYGVDDITSVQAVPEPSSVALVVGGLGLLIGLRRRRGLD